ncbi:MAG: hypothetical protein IT334_12215 [Thermomicrobiales bacterium]|nr:hypothetical protein [Thermomicrobiales bacterium]
MTRSLCDNHRMKRKPPVIHTIMALFLIVTLAACGGGSSSPTPTPQPQVTPTPGGIDIPRGERPSGSFSGLSQRLLFDRCRVTIPLTWTSFGNQTGVTPTGANFTINGGSIPTDVAWERAVQLVASQATRRGVGEMIRGDDWVYAKLANDRGFTYRVRFGDRFCDVAVLGTGPASGDEVSAWPAIINSIELEPSEP